MSSVSLPSFPFSVPTSRHRPLLGRVPSGRFPHVFAPTAVLRLLVRPTALVFPRAAVPGLHRSRRDLPGSWAALAYVPRPLTPVEPSCRGPGPAALCFGMPISPSAVTTTSASTTRSFGARSRGPHARCLRFALTVTRRCLRARKTRYRLVTSSLGGEDFHLGLLSGLLAATTSFSGQAYPGAL